ncbi:MAG: glycosyltransferase family 2 protein [Phycisphaerae bacterium]
MPGVTVIIPCYNEQEMIAETVRQVGEVMVATARPFEIIVIDDGSTDATESELEACADQPGLLILRNSSNRGYGYCIKRAVGQARHDIVVITDADGTYPNGRIGELIELMGDSDMVVGARTTARSDIPIVRRPAKWVLTKLASYLAGTPIPDINSGLRAMKRSLIKEFIHFLPDGFSFTTTISLALLTHGYDVRYVPIEYAKRVGKSSIRPIRDTANFASLIVRTVMYFKPLKVFVPLSAGLFGLAVLWGLVSKLVFGQLADVSVVVISMASLQVLAIGLLADLIDKRFCR